MYQMATLEKTNKGRELKISIRKKDRKEIREMLKLHGSIHTWYELLEYALCNGWTSLEDQIALWSNPFTISNEISQDDGSEQVIGLVYYYPNYETKCPIEELLKNGYILLCSTKEDWQDCDICGQQHPKGFEGDCRDDQHRKAG